MQMNCEDFKKLLDDTGNLVSDQQLKPFSGHLKKCSDCRSVLNHHQQFFRSMTAPELSSEKLASLKNRVLDSLPAETAEVSEKFSAGFVDRLIALLPLRVAVAGLALTVLFIAVMIANHNNGRSLPPMPAISAQVASAQGAFTVFSSGGQAAAPAENGIVRSGDALLLQNQKCDLTLISGQQLQFLGTGRLTFATDTVNFNGGEAHVQVETGGRPLLFSLPGFSFDVVGTSFLVKASARCSEMTLLDGKVDLRLSDGMKKRLNPGEVHRTGESSEAILPEKPADSNVEPSPKVDASEPAIIKNSEAESEVNVPDNSLPARPAESGGKIGTLDGAF